MSLPEQKQEMGKMNENKNEKDKRSRVTNKDIERSKSQQNQSNLIQQHQLKSMLQIQNQTIADQVRRNQTIKMFSSMTEAQSLKVNPYKLENAQSLYYQMQKKQREFLLPSKLEKYLSLKQQKSQLTRYQQAQDLVSEANENQYYAMEMNENLQLGSSNSKIFVSQQSGDDVIENASFFSASNKKSVDLESKQNSASKIDQVQTSNSMKISTIRQTLNQSFVKNNLSDLSPISNPAGQQFLHSTTKKSMILTEPVEQLGLIHNRLIPTKQYEALQIYKNQQNLTLAWKNVGGEPPSQFSPQGSTLSRKNLKPFNISPFKKNLQSLQTQQTELNKNQIDDGGDYSYGQYNHQEEPFRHYYKQNEDEFYEDEGNLSSNCVLPYKSQFQIKVSPFLSNQIGIKYDQSPPIDQYFNGSSSSSQGNFLQVHSNSSQVESIQNSNISDIEFRNDGNLTQSDNFDSNQTFQQKIRSMNNVADLEQEKKYRKTDQIKTQKANYQSTDFNYQKPQSTASDQVKFNKLSLGFENSENTEIKQRIVKPGIIQFGNPLIPYITEKKIHAYSPTPMIHQFQDNSLGTSNHNFSQKQFKQTTDDQNRNLTNYQKNQINSILKNDFLSVKQINEVQEKIAHSKSQSQQINTLQQQSASERIVLKEPLPKIFKALNEKAKLREQQERQAKNNNSVFSDQLSAFSAEAPQMDQDSDFFQYVQRKVKNDEPQSSVAAANPRRK